MTYHSILPAPARTDKNAGIRCTGGAVTRQETTSFPNPSPNPIGLVLRLGPCCIQNRLYFHESSAHTSVSKLSEPLELVAGLRRQVFILAWPPFPSFSFPYDTMQNLSRPSLFRFTSCRKHHR